VHPFLDHIEEHLGPIHGGGLVHEGAEGGAKVHAVRFGDCPEPGASTIMTLGLTHHVSHQAEGPDVRVEFLIACRDGMVDGLNPASVLADVCDAWARTHHAPARGTVIGPKGRFHKEWEMEALYCSAPTYFHEGLLAFSGFLEPFLPIWLVPITRGEAHYIRERGWPAFESRLAEADADLLDLRRPPLV
jgi:hypothetical protein